ncbi:MAG: hypothetical protein HOW73_30960 [Polyangiaceae bacterium]|nr:hypothetical protein [Polyangiaceae bacterium]
MNARSTIFALALAMAACAGQDFTEPPTVEEEADIAQTVSDFKRASPDIQKFFDEAHAYAIFPSVGRGGLGIGGARGTGWVFENGEVIGSTTMNMLTVGAQAGGQAYAEILFFKDADALSSFKAGRTELGAEATAVVLKQKATAEAGYNTAGIAVFVLPKGGAMAEASVGGQKFSFEPLEGTQ